MDMTFKYDFGLAIRHLRENRCGWSQGKLSQKTGIPRTTISMWETGQRKGPSPGHLAKLAWAFGLGIEGLYYCAQIAGHVNEDDFYQICLDVCCLREVIVTPNYLDDEILSRSRALRLLRHQRDNLAGGREKMPQNKNLKLELEKEL